MTDRTPRMLLCNRSQFGYHIDTYYYCKYLRARFDLAYIGWDYGRPRLELDGVRVTYISRAGSKMTRYFRFLLAVYKESRNGYDICFFKYFYGCSLIKIGLSQCKCICDIRTAHIMGSRHKRIFFDTLIKLESLFFENVTIISEGLKDRLFPKRKDVYVLPLGSDIISVSRKIFDEIHLLYVGTLGNRNIDQTVLGFERFYRKHWDRLKLSYAIVGDGYRGEKEILSRLVRERNLDGVVHIEGRVPHEKLRPFFDKCNIGVSYIPLTEYFDRQPPTKTFEYLLSGMPVLATRTSENRRIINESNGVLVDDNPESFAQGLTQLCDRRYAYDSDQIRRAALVHTWENIVRDRLEPYLRSL